MPLTLEPRKSLGQHFLHDPGIIGKLIKAIAPDPKDKMVEIGCGLGALTLPLLRTVKTIQVIELDKRMTEHLMKTVNDKNRLVIHNDDALKINFQLLTNRSNSLRVVGNLPYNISTPLLFHLLNYRAVIKDIHVMLQKEVATRITAKPGGKDYGRLTVMLSPWIDAETCFNVGPGAFNPPPKVKSTVLRLKPRINPRFPLKHEKNFSALVSRAFSMRRKTLRNSLRGWLSQEQITSVGIDPNTRPERVSPEEFGKLAEFKLDKFSSES
ncbi:MAG: 16S rRNA (adenine(1518)-N(6)/adenine(1519)-N(6))-dimethyltransferase [Rhodospirillaceae bacterium]|nr:16S rRNA (adenine(1518)-N(6)/adenine(1519)-N(6))-dimethyltransferase [Rhodospirillaceae bacterium]|tara:strand:+ start:9541 stop:10344 length:804 start_codon:yes stop_codon:yes gene_type:complete